MADLAQILEGRKANPRTGNYKKLKGRDDVTRGLFECPFCGSHRTRVTSTYRIGQGPDYKKHGFLGVTRRRLCIDCDVVFTTHEKVPTRETLLVIKRSGAREPFDRDKMALSIQKALCERTVSKERLHRIVLSIEAQLQPKQKDGDIDMVRTRYRTVTSQQIGALVLNSLRELDEVAYVRYASIFLRFKSVDYFEQLLAGMRPVLELT